MVVLSTGVCCRSVGAGAQKEHLSEDMVTIMYKEEKA